MKPTIITTDRLILRPWREDDLEPFAALNADPRVMECFPSVKTWEETKQEYDRICSHIDQYDFGFWAVELKDSHQFIGMIGIKHVTFEAGFTPAVEIGWRLAHEHWGKGYASEGAKAALAYGFNEVGLDEIVSFTTVGNQRSRNVMEKIGMKHEEDFAHPFLPKDHPLSLHALYRIKNEH